MYHIDKTEEQPDCFRVYQTKNTSPNTEYPSNLYQTPAMKLFSPHRFSQVISGATDFSFDFCAKETFRGKPSHQIGFKNRRFNVSQCYKQCVL